MNNMDEIKTLLEELIKKFNAKLLEDTSLKKVLANINRTVQIEFTDGKKYKLLLSPNGITDFAEGEFKNADVRIISDTTTFKALINKEIGPMKAFVTGKLKIKASFTDLEMLRKFIS